MAQGGEVPDDLNLYQDFVDARASFPSSSCIWDQELGCFPTYDDHVAPGFYGANADPSAVPFEFEPAPGFHNDDAYDAAFAEITCADESWTGQDDYLGCHGSTELDQFLAHPPSPPPRFASLAHSLQQPIDGHFAAQMTPPPMGLPQQIAIKEEHSPTLDPTPHPYSHLLQSTVAVPMHTHPLGSLQTTLTRVPFPMVAPPSPTSPVQRSPIRRKRASPSSDSSSPPAVDRSRATTKPKKRMIKQLANGSKAPMTAQQQALRRLINAEGTGVFHQHISSAEAAAANHAELMRMFAKAPEICTSPATDPTFPVRVPEQIAYVRDMYEAIWDWSDYGEMAKTLGEDNMALWRQAAALDDDDSRKAILLKKIPTRAEQQKKVLSRPLSDYIVEQICWRLLKFAQDAQQGIATVDYCLRTSKQLVKSLLSAGNGWCMRIANNPKGEFTHKINNMKVNRRKNERLREATNAQKKEEE